MLGNEIDKIMNQRLMLSINILSEPMSLAAQRGQCPLRKTRALTVILSEVSTVNLNNSKRVFVVIMDEVTFNESAQVNLQRKKLGAY